MNFEEIKSLDGQYIMSSYARFPVALVSGRGAYAYDTEGREYIDFGAGIGVNSLGYADAGWADAVAKQARTLQHASNLYYSPVQARLAEKLCALSGLSKVFFANSGAEANECAVKLARKYSLDTHGEGRHTVVTLADSFHGRTVTTLAATGQDAFHRFFGPFTQGFRHVPPNDLPALREALDGGVCALMLEPVLGEGGVLPLEADYLRAAAALCAERDILLICDEVQSGIGRTGAVFAYRHAGVEPDVVTAAKGLGGGLPIGACLCAEKLSGVLSAGLHGSTFGGNPVACAGALYVLETVCDPAFLKDVERKGETARRRVREMPGVLDVRGRGLMLGAVLDGLDAKRLAALCLEKGLLVLTAKTLLRLLPPLNIDGGALEKGLDILEKALAELSRQPRKEP